MHECTNVQMYEWMSKVVKFISELFGMFDALTDKFEVYKVLAYIRTFVHSYIRTGINTGSNRY